MGKKSKPRASKKCHHSRTNFSRVLINLNRNNRILKNKIRKKNPSIFHFNIDSSFIYEPRYCSFSYNQLVNKKKMKPSAKQIIYLQDIIKKLENEHLNSKFPNKIQILSVYKEYFNNMIPIPPFLDERAKRVKKIIDVSNKNLNISCRRISQEYKELYNEKISHTTINKILKKQLNYHFIKASIKTDKLLKDDSIKQTYFFIYIFLRALNMGLNFIFIDETCIETKNNNYRNWIKKNEDIHFNIGDNEKRNLLMAVSPYKTVYFEITNKNTNSNVFKDFFENMLNKLSNEEKTRSVFILDNLSSHATLQMFDFYNSKKLKILFGVPYFSKLNMIELCFRGIKNILYKNLFSTIKDVEEKVKKIIMDNDFISSYKFFFKETLNNYLNFINNN